MAMQRRSVLALGAASVAVTGLMPARSAVADGHGAVTEVKHLSGLDKDHTVDWEFMVTSGRNSGMWSVIPVPSNWETKGFGTYRYGFNLAPEEKGLYRHRFAVPATWRDRRTFLVFEGSMTDTEVRVNGQSAGPTHRGGFYRFRYDVTGLLAYGQPNLLEVMVSRESADASVNRAERQGDYWNFSGIYRPVYLQAYPTEHIDRLAVDARADGSLAVDAHLGGITSADRLVAQVRRLDGSPLGPPFSAAVPAGATAVRLTTTISRPLLWTAETPNLYQVTVRLCAGRLELHQVGERFGFRTVEVRAGDGVYVNGRKVILKGVNRHTFWPDSGRTTSPAISRMDILLIKEMNMNAVRMSHYPPDVHFLDLCDELGLYVLDELAGWQKAYDEAAAVPLVAEMVTRDVNHPSILFWDNGNEGGWNTAVDDDFALYDPQRRTVLHPWANFNGIDTDHYETYDSTRNKLSGSTIFMSTEFLHGLYDGGAGAGLNDYWSLMGNRPLSAGGFIWALLDEGVVRDDQGGRIDVVGNAAPDGILGPFRQKEASFNTIREIWSPIQLTFADGQLSITNRYGFTNANKCRFTWKLLSFPPPGAVPPDRASRVGEQDTVDGPNIPPGGGGTLRLRLPARWRRSDALSLTVTDPHGKDIYTWVWTIKKAADHASRIVTTGGGTPVAAVEDAAGITMRATGVAVTVDKLTGRLANAPLSLTNGPALATGAATLTGITHASDGDAHVVEASYTGDLTFVRWRLYPSGWLQLTYHYHLTGSHDFLGVNFDYPQAKVSGMTWLGHGPYRVYKNRLRGVTTDVWSKKYNDTATGADHWEYPEFKGYHANTYWAQLHTTEGNLTVVADTEDLFLRLFTPRFGPDPRFTAVPFPAGDISFLDAIPPIGTKFDPPANLGPESQPNVAAGDYQRTLYLRFGD
jgi:hypothetical protein